jgi:hypothetical protein
VSLKVTVAAPFKNMRKEQLRKSEFIFFLAIDRKWMNKEQADLLLVRAEEAGLVARKGGFITPGFDVGQVTIPLGFKPSSDILEREDPLGELMERIASARDIPLPRVASEVNALIESQFDGNLRAEAAAVLIAERYSVPYEDKIGSLRKSVLETK